MALCQPVFRKGEVLAGARGGPRLEKAGWTGLITAGLLEHGGRGINHPGSMSPKSRVSSKSVASAMGRQGRRHIGGVLLSLGPRACLQPCWDVPRLLSQKAGGRTPPPPTPAHFPGGPADFPGSLIKSEKPSTLWETPRGGGG